MAFIIKTVSQRSGGGGDIVRESRLEGDSLIVGRGADCDIQIADLAVMLRHARLTLAGGRLVAEQIGGVDLQAGRKFAPRIDIASGEAVTLALGSHVLDIVWVDGVPSLTLRQVAALSDAAEAKDEVKVFSLQGGAFGKRRLAWGLTLGVLLLFLIWPVAAFLTAAPRPAVVPLKPGQTEAIPAHKGWAPDQTWTSGTLSSAHASLANDCGACHQKAFVSVTDATCKSCHAKTEDHAPLDRQRLAMFEPGLPGTANRQLAHAFNLPEGRCASCHKEHEGTHGMATTNSGQCADCHTDLTAKLPDTKLGNAGDFTTEHPQLQPAIVATPAFGQPRLVRVSMDGKPRENSGLKFPHDIHLSKTNGVAKMAIELSQYGGKALDCASCHRPSAGSVRFQPIEMERDCGACHSLAFDRAGGTIRTLRHGEPKQVVAELRDFYRLGGAAADPVDRQRPGFAVQSVARGGARPLAGMSVDARIRAVFEPGGACYDCHTVIAPKAAGSLDFGIAPVSLPDRYLWNGWFSHADHDTRDMPCGSCHKATTSKVSADLLLPDLKRCRDCHVSPAHAAKDKTVSDCAACHVYHEGSPLPSQIRGARTAQADPKRKTG